MEKQLLKPEYDKITAYFLLIGKVFEGKTRKKSVDISNLKDGDSVLIIAPPTEFYLNSLLRLNPHGNNHLLYFSKRLRQESEKLLKKETVYSIELCNGHKFPYDNSCFDHIFAFCYLDFLEKEGLEPAVKEIHRVLKKRGNLMTTYLTNPKNFLEKLSISLFHKLSIVKDINSIDIIPYLHNSNFKVVTKFHFSQKFVPVDLVYAEK